MSFKIWTFINVHFQETEDKFEIYLLKMNLDHNDL
jgi:hypothetical protein